MRSKKLLILFAVLLLSALEWSELSAQENIVPNPGFENYSNYPLGWFYKGADFTRVIKYWNAPTAASPDVFGPKVRIPSKWAEKGFGEMKPKAGKSFVGITTYGCEGGKPHCREYVQIQLSEPLVVDQEYQVSFWVAPVKRSLRCDKIGAYFSQKEIREATDEPLFFKPHIESRKIIGGNGWQKVTGRLKAEQDDSYIIIGNFYPDEMTRTQTVSNNLNFGYYYLDEIEVKKLEPILAVPEQKGELTRSNFAIGTVIRLDNIFFDHDKSELLPRSFTELNNLAQILNDYPAMRIEIRGHTDGVGEQSYNLPLSERRAKAVVDYLIQSGIAHSRLVHQGYGSAMPVANNSSKEGRQENRRVEFKILSK